MLEIANIEIETWDSKSSTDVITCLANLSADEVFTPPKIANHVLNLLPKELFTNPQTTFCDPFCKSGVFLREIAKRLIKGLKNEIPDLKQRVEHIFTKQIFGLSTSELTGMISRRSLYCSRNAAGEHSACRSFTTEEGNIFYALTKHAWDKKGKCKYCGASDKNYDRSDNGGEDYAYSFIHENIPAELLNMKFDVILGNPPYQLADGGSGRSASPIYNKFIEAAKQLNPAYMCFIIPSRWMGGGKGLDKFRSEMLNDSRIKKLVDYENSNEVFPSVDFEGGVCYFLWDRHYQGNCEIISIEGDKRSTANRPLNEFPIFIRQNQAIPILRKVLKKLDIDLAQGSQGHRATNLCPLKSHHASPSASAQQHVLSKRETKTYERTSFQLSPFWPSDICKAA